MLAFQRQDSYTAHTVGLATQLAQVSVVAGVLVVACVLVVHRRSSASHFTQRAAVHAVVDEGEAGMCAHADRASARRKQGNSLQWTKRVTLQQNLT